MKICKDALVCKVDPCIHRIPHEPCCGCDVTPYSGKDKTSECLVGAICVSVDSGTDTLTRNQVIQFLDTVPLGYRTEAEAKFSIDLMHRIQKAIAGMPLDWKPSND